MKTNIFFGRKGKMLGGGPGSDGLDKIHMDSWQNIFIVAEENINLQ